MNKKEKFSFLKGKGALLESYFASWQSLQWWGQLHSEITKRI